VAQIGGAGWLADGVLPALPAMQRSIGVLSGRVSASAAPSLGADSLLADRLAARAFSSNDVGQYETLMTAGQRANRAGDFGAAERAYRAALQLQEKALGRDNPNVVNALMSLALQLSNQGRAIEADALFARADGLASHATDGSSVARLAHYRGLNALNQGHFDDALARLRRAETMYAALVPPDRLTARQPAKLRGFNTSLLPGQNTLSDLTTQDALLGIIEARRNQGIALRELGRPAEGEAVVERARSFAIDVGLNQSIVSARVSRTMGVGLAAAGKPEEAASDLDAAGAAFQRGAPATKPVAMTALLRAKELAATNRTAEALASCHGAFALLASLKAGAEPALVAPCLNAYYAEAGRQVANRQALLAEMFSAAQLAQGGVTSKQIAQATARLLENARDPKVAVAIRVREDAAAALTQLYRRRDEQVQDRAQGIAVSAEAQAAQDKKLSDAQAAAAEADEALQAASPNYGQLVQQAVSAADVMAALHPGEAFASIALTDTDGFVLLLHDGTIDAARIAGGGPRMTALVKTLRASIEPTATLPTFDVAASIELYTALFGSLRLDGVKTLVVAPTGALLSLPFEVLLTGPADAGLAGAPWLVRRMSIAHVPAPSNFVSLRKLAGTSRARQPWFGFGDFKPSDDGAGRTQLSGPVLRRQRQVARRPAAAAVRHSRARRRPCPARRFARRRTTGAGLHRCRRGENPAQGLPHPALRHPRAAAGRAAMPERGGDHHVGPGGRGGRVGRAAHRVRGDGHGPRRRQHHPVRLQFRRAWRRGGGREPVRTGAQLLLRGRAQPARHALVGERPGGRVPDRRHSAAIPRDTVIGDGRRPATGATRHHRRCRKGIAGLVQPPVLLGAVRVDRRGQRGDHRPKLRPPPGFPSGGASIS